MTTKFTVVWDGIALASVADVVFDEPSTRDSRSKWPFIYYEHMRKLVTTLFMARKIGINETFWKQPAKEQVLAGLGSVLRPINLSGSKLEDDIRKPQMMSTVLQLMGFVESSFVLQMPAERWKHLVITDFEKFVKDDPSFELPPPNPCDVVFKKKQYLKVRELLNSVPNKVTELGARWVADAYPEYSSESRKMLLVEFVKQLIPTHIAIACQYRADCEFQEQPTDYFPSGPRASLVEHGGQRCPPDLVLRLITPYVLDRFLRRFANEEPEQISAKFFPRLIEYCLNPEDEIEKQAQRYCGEMLAVAGDPVAWRKEATKLKRAIEGLRPDKYLAAINRVPVHVYSGGMDVVVEIPFPDAVRRKAARILNSRWWIQESSGGREHDDVEKDVRRSLARMFPATFDVPSFLSLTLGNSR